MRPAAVPKTSFRGARAKALIDVAAVLDEVEHNVTSMASQLASVYQVGGVVKLDAVADDMGVGATGKGVEETLWRSVIRVNELESKKGSILCDQR